MTSFIEYQMNNKHIKIFVTNVKIISNYSAEHRNYKTQ